MQHPSSPFHAGEHMLQLRAGSRAGAVAAAGRLLATRLGPDDLSGLTGVRACLVAVRGTDGAPRLQVMAGPDGVLDSPDPGRVCLRWTVSVPSSPPPPVPTRVSILAPPYGDFSGIRINGTVLSATAAEVVVGVDAVLGSGRRYAHVRGSGSGGVPVGAAMPAEDDASALAALVERADTLVLATCHPDPASDPRHGTDIAMRAGLPGFVVLDGGAAILWAELPGSDLFTTLGNLMLENRCSVLLSAAGSGTAALLHGRGEVLWRDPQLRERLGAERGVRLHIAHLSMVSDLLGACHPLLHYAPALAGTARDGQWRSMRVSAVDAETADASSLRLETGDGQPLLPFRAGQHLRVRVAAPGAPVQERCYSLSQYSARPGYYRITVRHQQGDRPGVSAALRQGAAGRVVEVSAPQGGFTLPENLERPLVMASAGIGITPMVAMLQELAGRCPDHEVWFFHAARNGRSVPLRRDLAALRDVLPGTRWHQTLSRPEAGDRPGVDYEAAGRLGVVTLRRVLPFNGYDFYLCGPDPFLLEFYQGLKAIGVADARIHIESFGLRTGAGAGAGAGGAGEYSGVVLPVERTVRFLRSGVTARWTPAAGSLLDVALAAGVQAPSSCRTGMCGTCRQPLLAGHVAYARAVTAPVSYSHPLLCSTVPASDVDVDL